MADWNLDNAAHLLRRVGFGGTPGEIQDFFDRHASVESAVDELLSFRPSKRKPPLKKTLDDDDKRKMQAWWIKTMVKARRPADACREKLVLFFHNFLVSGASKQPELRFMGLQNRLFRLHAGGNFKTLIREFNRDPANLYYLDGILNDARDGRNFQNSGIDVVVANENWGRELMELFSLGVFQFAADGSDDPTKPNYSEDDVHNLARASTGWVDIEGEVGVWNPNAWDGGEYDDDGDGFPDPMVIFGHSSSSFRMYSPDEPDADVAADDVLNLICQRVDDDGNNQVAIFVARKVWEWYAFPAPEPGLKAELAACAAAFVAENYDLKALYRAVFTHDWFYSDKAKTRTVKTPVDFVAAAFKSFGARSNGKYVGDASDQLGDQLANMGMDLFEPPNVAGWPGGSRWITSATLLERLAFARDLAAADFGANRLKFKKIEGLPLGVAAADPVEVLSVILRHLGLDTGLLALNAAQQDTLLDYATDSGAKPTLDLSNEYTDDVQTKVRGLIALALQSAEFQIF